MRNIFISTSTYAKYSNKPLKLLESEGFEVNINSLGRKLNMDEIIDVISKYDGVIAGTETYNKEVLDKAKKLKVISRLGVGLDNIDMDYAKKKQITILKTKTTPALAVSELSLGLILSLLRKISSHNYQIKNGTWEKNMGFLFSGKTLGIIGLGTIGKSLVKLVKGFDLKILAYDLERDNVFSKKYNISYAELDYLLKDSDIVSIHLNYSNDLKNFINYEKIEMMKSNAIIINTSRGEIINETDLEIALKNNILAGAGLDVFNEEPYSGNLKKYDNVLMTPHIGSYAKEIRIKMELEAVENLILGLKNE